MNLNHTEEQKLLISSVRALVERHGELPTAERRSQYSYAHRLAEELESGEFMDVAITPGMSAVEAALVVEEVSSCARVVEIGASALVAPHLIRDLPRPVALLTAAEIAKPHRFLKEARSALVLLEDEDDVAVIDLRHLQIEHTESIFAYPFGRFKEAPDLTRANRLGGSSAAVMRQWWRLAIAAECAGAMRSAVDFTVEYVKERQVFGRPLGMFQAIQHRLAQCHEIVTGLHWLLMRAAWSKTPLDATLVATYAQQHVQKLSFDLHQFNGGMGVTLEHKLHFWTYRFRALQGELGGQNASALAAAKIAWGPGSTPVQLPSIMGGSASKRALSH